MNGNMAILHSANFVDRYMVLLGDINQICINRPMNAARVETNLEIVNAA